MNVTEKVARFVANARYEEIPGEAICVAKEAIKDCLGVTLAAVNEPASVAMVDLLRELGGNPMSSVVGAGLKTSPPLAALANGTMSHALDYDDVTYTMAGHPSVPVLPAVLAVCDYAGASGRDAVLAYLIGYEVETKLGRSIAPRFYTQGWHPTAVLGTMGAAAASARLLGLSAEQCAISLGIAASQASGLRQNFGTDTKPFHPGNAARSGVLAAMLARKGFTADAGILDGPQGFLNAFGEANQAELGPLVEGLGSPWDIVAVNPSIKFYPCCAVTHRPLDTILHMVSSMDIDPGAVASISCAIPEKAKVSLIRSNPSSGLAGKFSLEYTVSAAIIDKRIGLKTFTDEQVMRPNVRALMDKFHWEDYTGEITGDYQVTITVKMTDGRKLTHSVKQPKGSPDVPLSPAELETKYCDCARVALSEEDVKTSSEMLANLDKLADMRQLTAIVGKKK